MIYLLKYTHRNRARFSLKVGRPYISFGKGAMFQLFTCYYDGAKVGVEFFSAVVLLTEWGEPFQRKLYYEARDKAEEKAKADLLKEAKALIAPR